MSDEARPPLVRDDFRRAPSMPLVSCVPAKPYREGGQRWFELRQLPQPPKSSCVFCPYQGDAQWAAMKANHVDDDWSRAVEFDEAIRPYFQLLADGGDA